MEFSRNELFYEMSVFNDELDAVDSNDEKSIVSFCLKLEKYLYEKNLICKRYQVYKKAWETFNANVSMDISTVSLFELFVYLFIYSREEHFSGGYGYCYVEAFKKGCISKLIKEIVNKLEVMAKVEADSSDKTGRIGVAGEFFVVAELTRRGYVASLTSKNTKAIDMLVSDKNGNRSVAVQIKACDNAKQYKWKMSSSVEENYATSLYYVFVNLNEGREPSYYVVPSAYVAYRVRQDYEEWYNAPGKKGQKHNPTTMRTFEFVDEDERLQFKDAWHLLGI